MRRPLIELAQGALAGLLIAAAAIVIVSGIPMP